ncbi:MAG: hypothetical protein WC141_07040 [Arcobacteraceae bacterium]
MQKALTLFKELFSPSENIAILHINNQTSFLDEAIESVALEFNGKVKVIEFKEEKEIKLNGVAREYEYIILSNVLKECSNKDKVLQLMYRALENSGNIIIVEEKSKCNEDEIKELLDKAQFLAMNNIDDLFETYHCFTAKKMHMWGNGL